MRRNDLRAGLVGLSFTLMAGLLAVHGLATPGIFLEEYGRNAVVGLAGALAVPAAGVVLALAVYAPPALPGADRLIVRAQLLAILALLCVRRRSGWSGRSCCRRCRSRSSPGR